jgi:microcystin-dependent protein
MMGIWPTGTPPTGWLECDGRALSRSTYNDLFDRIGTSWGVGDGTTTFNIPDLRDAFPMGRSGTNIIASSGGSASTSHNHSGVTSGPSADVAVQSGADTDVATDAHNHTISSSVLDNRPPYKAVLFIIKVTI